MFKNRNIGLRSAIILVGILGELILIGLYGLDRWQARALVLENSDATLSVLARVLQEHATQILAGAGLLMHNVKTAVEAQPSLAAIDHAAMHSELKHTDDDAAFISGISIIDASGIRVVSSDSENPAPVRFNDRNYFKTLRDDAELGLYIGQLITRNSTHQLWTPLALRINAKDGGFAGVVFAGLPLKYFQKFYSGLNFFPSSRISLMFNDGRPLFSVSGNSSTDGSFSEKSYVNHPLFEKINSATHSGIYHGVGLINGNERIVAYDKLENFPLVVMVSVDRDQMLAPWQHATERTVPFVIIIGLGIGLATSLLARHGQQREKLSAQTITAMMVAENASKQLHDIADNLPVLIAYLDTERKFRFINKTGALWHAKSVADMLGKTASEVTRLPYVVETPTLLEELSKGPSRQERTIQYPDGVMRTIDHLAIPDKGPDGKLRGYYRLGTDITERKKSELLLIEARAAAEAGSRSKSEFLACMSHEIRTPMNGVLGFTDMLLETPLNPQQKEYLTYVRDSGQTLLTILNDILDYSKIESGKIALEIDNFDPVAMTNSVMSLLRSQAEKKNVKLSFSVAPNIPSMLRGDSNRLRKILLNLIGNAIKFTEQGFVQVRLSCSDPGGDPTLLRFEVEDSGIGISEEDQRHLFNLFSQVDNSIARRFGGTGLGLAISKSLAELMGGEIGVRSKEGEGSIFWFTAQLLPAIARDVRPADPAVSNHRKDHGRILVVDDVEINQRMVALMLEGMGYAVDIASGGREALACLAKDNFDVVLLDLHMPDMDGFETIMRIRSMSGPVASVPVLAMTADAMPGIIEKCLSAGMNGYVAKPVIKSDLLSAISTAMANNRI